MIAEIGKIYRVKDPKRCANFYICNGVFIKITYISGKGILSYDILDFNKARIERCDDCFTESDLLPLGLYENTVQLKKTLRDVVPGDIIVNKWEGKAKVVDVFPNSFSWQWGDDMVIRFITFKSAEKEGWKICSDQIGVEEQEEEPEKKIKVKKGEYTKAQLKELVKEME